MPLEIIIFRGALVIGTFLIFYIINIVVAFISTLAPYLSLLPLYSVNLRVQSEYGKIRSRKNSVFEHFSRSDCLCDFIVAEKSEC